MKILTTTTDYEALHQLAEQDERIKPLLPKLAANTLKVSELSPLLKVLIKKPMKPSLTL